MKSASPHSAFTWLLLLQSALAQDSVRFFYSRVKDGCEWGSSNTFAATGQTKNGGICAYTNTNRLYACPAPDPMCWTIAQTCKAGAATAGSNQILCSAGDTQWCCASSETCTITPNQANVCISNFTSPNSGVTSDQASAKEFSAIPSASIGTSVPAGTPSVFSTRQLKATSTATKESSSSSTSSSTATAAPGKTGTKETAVKRPSGAAIAGIIIGVIAIVLIVTGAIVLLVIHKRRAAAKANQQPGYEKDGPDYYGPQGPQGQQGALHEVHGSPQYGEVAPAKVAPSEPQTQPQELPAHPIQEMP